MESDSDLIVTNWDPVWHEPCHSLLKFVALLSVTFPNPEFAVVDRSFIFISEDLDIHTFNLGINREFTFNSDAKRFSNYDRIRKNFIRPLFNLKIFNLFAVGKVPL